jgi:hypothetical protein
LKQKKLMRKISLTLILFVMITILPAYKAQATSGTYGVTIWTTDGNYVRGISATDYLTVIKTFYQGQNAAVNMIDSGHLSSNSLNGTNLLWVVLPKNDFTADDITYMGNFLATGGRIVFCGEHPGFFAIGDGYITKAVSALGGSFSIKNSMHQPTSGIVTGPGVSKGSSLTDGLTGFYYAAAAEISYLGKAQVVIDALDGLPLVMDQPVGKGRITLFTDINTWDPVASHSASQGNNGVVFANLMKDAKVNQDTVAAGGDPNIGYGHEQVTIPTASPMGGDITAGSIVTLSTATTGAEIHFTTNSTTPNVGSTTSSSVTINGTVGSRVVVKAIAIKDDMNDSDVATFTYKIVAPQKVALSSQSVTGLTAGDANITGLVNTKTYNAQIVSGTDIGKYVSEIGVVGTSVVPITGVIQITGLTNGTIGQLLQIVNSGDDGNTVTAVPNENYHFVKWSDGKTNASRKDIDVDTDIEVRAIFEVNYSTYPIASVTGVIPVSNNSSNSSSSSSGSSSSKTEQINVAVTNGSSNNSVSQIVIQRITLSDGTKKDTVTYTAEKAKETIAALLREGKDVARIVATDKDKAVTETAINIPKDTLSALSSGNVNLEIETNGVRLLLPKTSIQDLPENGQLAGDLYFRVIPIKDEAKQQEIKTTANKEKVIKAVSGKDGIQVLGTPMTIETNMSGGNVDIVLPLKGVTILSDPAEREAFLKDLGVFIEHSDGEKVLEKGEIVEYEPGVYGIKFTVNKFSDFTIVKLNQDAKAIEGWKNDAQGWKYIKDGQPTIGWNLINGYWYLMDSTGIMETGWRQTNGTWYLLNSDGAMAIGWKQINGYWYLLNNNGSMMTGWQKVNEKWYYLYEDGSMASNTVVDSYTVDESGAWVQ